MNTSQASASTSGKHTLLQLRNAFWAAKAMERWREQQCNYIRVAEMPRLRDYGECLFGDGPPKLPAPYIEFHFIGALYGDETWVAVVAEGKVVVPPFQLPAGGPSALPYFPEELANAR